MSEEVCTLSNVCVCTCFVERMLTRTQCMYAHTRLIKCAPLQTQDCHIHQALYCPEQTEAYIVFMSKSWRRQSVVRQNSLCCVCRYILRLCMLETREEAPHYGLGVRPVSTAPMSNLLLCTVWHVADIGLSLVLTRLPLLK